MFACVGMHVEVNRQSWVSFIIQEPATLLFACLVVVVEARSFGGTGSFPIRLVWLASKPENPSFHRFPDGAEIAGG